ncbi:MAG TPA: hypothetical protein VMW33_13755 [Ilumatobacteraceae bacterium]|jgi:hypothetical protein|nr:hypothetical protein [Ilumatobacteraceae bacterium]
MQRLCGRPGCSDVASVVYGMRAEDLVFWIDRLPDPLDEGAAVLCRRHADSMVVPRGWTLDDLRDPDLHLFRPPLPAPTARTRATRAPRERAVGEQLRLDAEPAAEDAAIEIEIEIETDTPVGSQTEPDPDLGPWTPSFDEADDLDGLLSARSPLLSRAFRTADRPAE